MRKITLPRGSISYGESGRGITGSFSHPAVRLMAMLFLLCLVKVSGAWPITFLSQPADVTDCEDHVVSFRVVISGGTEPVVYTWQRQRPEESEFSDIPAGAPNISYPAPGTLRVDNVGSYENPGGSLYRVIVSDYFGSITSGAALLTVNEITDIIPSIAIPLKTNVILCEGADFSYTVTTSGMPPLSYQWKKHKSPGIWENVTDNAVIAGSQTAVLAFSGSIPAVSGEYKVNITFPSSGADCQVESSTRKRVLTVQANPEAPVIQGGQTVCLGYIPGMLSALPAEGGSGIFAYQWQISPDGISWDDIEGATSLDYQPEPLFSPTWYRVAATDGGTVSCGNTVSLPLLIPVTDCTNLHYRSVRDGNWMDPATWETSADGISWGAPAYTWPVKFMHTIHIRNGHLVSVTDDLAVDEVTVEAGGAVTVESGATLTNSDPGGSTGFVIQASETTHGSLIVNGSFSGTLTYLNYFNPSRWTIMSAPLKVTTGFGSNSSRISFNSSFSEYDFAWYKEERNDGWIYYPTLPAGLVPGQGYLIRTADTNEPEEGIISFSGTVNGEVNDTVSPAVYLTHARHGWNSVGNPFTSAIGATAGAVSYENFLTRNASILEDSYAAVYVWNQTGTYDGSQQYYKAIGNSGYVFQGFSYYGGDDPDYLQAGQGFLINVKGMAKAVFSKSMQVHLPAVRLKSSGHSWPGLILEAESDNKVRRTVVSFHTRMTRGLDKTYDAGLLSSGNFRIYTRLVSGDTGADLEIQCLPDGQYDNLEIPVGLDLPQGGNVTFRVSGIVLPRGIFPILEDTQLQLAFPLKSESSAYTAHVPVNTRGTGRFLLRFGNTATATPAVQQAEIISAWFSDGKIKIRNSAGTETTAVLYDLYGRTLGEYSLLQTDYMEIPVRNPTSGIYLLNLRTREGNRVSRIAVTVNGSH